MSSENTRNPGLIVILSVLGVLAVALLSGLLLMQKQENPGAPLSTALSSRQETPAGDDFDPISWAREGAAYPPLEEAAADEGEFVADFTGTGIADEGESEAEEAEVKVQPAAVETKPAPAVDPEPVYREVRENAYWVQMFSSPNVSRAEEIRDELTAKGLPANVIVREVNGETMYRVRLGAFNNESEADHYAKKARDMSGFESSFVVQAPVTRQIAGN